MRGAMLANHGVFRAGRTQGLLLPLDSVTPAAAAFSLRRLRSAYTGSAIRVRRSSDNAELDIGFSAVGDLNTAALLSHVGAGSGFVTTWYDQSGNARNATQGTAANQPRIVHTGVVDLSGSRPALVFSGTQVFFNSGVGLPQGATGRMLNATYQAANANIMGVVGYGTAASQQQFVLYRLAGSDPYASGFAADVGSGFTFDTSLKTSTILYTGVQWELFRNGVAGAVSAATLNTVIGRGFSIGNGTGGGQDFFVGTISETVLLPSIATTDRQQLERNQGSYYGITVA